MWIAFGVAVAGMAAATAVTGWRATRLTGDPKYLFSCTTVFVKRHLDPETDQDAAFDAAMRDAGESDEQWVPVPMVVVGLLDATAPVAVLGAMGAGAVTWWARRRATRYRPDSRGIGTDSPSGL